MAIFTKKYTDPTNSQTAEQVETYHRNVKPGDVAVIRCTQGNILEFKVDKIAEGSPNRGRIYLEQGDPYGGRAWYAKNGKSCFHPKGQSNLVVPTEEVMAWIKEHTGVFGASVLTYEVDSNPIPPGQR